MSYELVPVYNYDVVRFILGLTLIASGFFWRDKEDLVKQMREQKKIVVSVVRQKKDKQEIFNFKGAGIVSAPASFCFNHAQKFERLSGVSSHFKMVNHDKSKSRAYIVMEAMGYEARMLVSYKAINTNPAEITWRVESGTLVGMNGKILFQEQPKSKTEMAILADMEADKIPLPSILAPFTLEIIAEKVAYKMREDIEQAYQQSQGKDKSGTR